MKNVLFILLVLSSVFHCVAQETSLADFKWGNSSYYNLNTGDSIFFKGTVVKLVKLENHFNHLQVGANNITLKVSRRTLPYAVNGIRIFIADNKNVKNLTSDNKVHGLLKNDALICVSDHNLPMLNPNEYFFPLSFHDGFIWKGEEDSHMFSYEGLFEEAGKKYYRSNEGIDIDLHDARGIEKHWIIAPENSKVVWVKQKEKDQGGFEASVLLESESHPGFYYVIDHLYNKNLEVKKGQKLIRGELISTAWGDKTWGHIQISVIKSDTIPSYNNRLSNSINFFPQLYELYHKQTFNLSNSFTKGKISFGKRCTLNGNRKNISAFEEYTGKGWILKTWNKADKVEMETKGEEGNARLRKVLFSGTKAACKNPDNWYDYELNVPNGVYRVRTKVGDLSLPSWQKIRFEGINVATYDLPAGKLKWTTERVVKIKDRKLTIRIYIDESNNKVAGLSEIVFQRAY